MVGPPIRVVRPRPGDPGALARTVAEAAPQPISPPGRSPFPPFTPPPPPQEAHTVACGLISIAHRLTSDARRLGAGSRLISVDVMVVARQVIVDGPFFTKGDPIYSRHDPWYCAWQDCCHYQGVYVCLWVPSLGAWHAPTGATATHHHHHHARTHPRTPPHTHCNVVTYPHGCRRRIRARPWPPGCRTPMRTSRAARFVVSRGGR